MIRRIRRGGIVMMGCLLPAVMLLGGCELEHSEDPWANSGQKELLGDELNRDEELAERLRERVADGQRDR